MSCAAERGNFPAWTGKTADPEPDRDVNYYEWVKWWYRQPKNQEEARKIERRYIEAMQRDQKLD